MNATRTRPTVYVTPAEPYGDSATVQREFRAAPNAGKRIGTYCEFCHATGVALTIIRVTKTLRYGEHIHCTNQHFTGCALHEDCGGVYRKTAVARG